MSKSRLTSTKQLNLIEHFVAGATARCVADLVNVNTKTATYYFYRLREIIYLEIESDAAQYFVGEIEVDELYFGGIGKRNQGRGVVGKVPVFGLLKRGGKIYTTIIPDAKKTTLIANH